VGRKPIILASRFFSLFLGRRKGKRKGKLQGQGLRFFFHSHCFPVSKEGGKERKRVVLTPSPRPWLDPTSIFSEKRKGGGGTSLPAGGKEKGVNPGPIPTCASLSSSLSRFKAESRKEGGKKKGEKEEKKKRLHLKGANLLHD